MVNMDKEKNGKKLIKKVQEMNNLPTTPICYIGGEPVGDYRDVLFLSRDGHLHDML